MASTGIIGERLIVAATLDPVHEGQLFERLPPHMTVVRWFSFPSKWQHELLKTMDSVFTNKDVFQNLQGGAAALYGEHNDVPVREMLGVETEPHFAIHALVKKLGAYPENDPFADMMYSPHVTDEPARAVAEGEHISIPTVALFAAHSDILHKKVVKAAFQLNALQDTETAVVNEEVLRG